MPPPTYDVLREKLLLSDKVNIIAGLMFYIITNANTNMLCSFIIHDSDVKFKSSWEHG